MRPHRRSGSTHGPRVWQPDTGYGSAEMLAWLVDERAIEPHIPVFDKFRPEGRHVLAGRFWLQP